MRFAKCFLGLGLLVFVFAADLCSFDRLTNAVGGGPDGCYDGTRLVYCSSSCDLQRTECRDIQGLSNVHGCYKNEGDAKCRDLQDPGCNVIINDDLVVENDPPCGGAQ